MDRVWIYVRKKTLDLAISALRLVGDREHHNARMNPVKAKECRTLGDDHHEAAKELRNQQHSEGHHRMHDESVRSSESSHVQIVKLDPGEKIGRAATWYFIALCIQTLIICAGAVVMGLNLAKQAQQDEDFRSMKTQLWLLERRLMDKEALDIVNGQKLPSDTEYGPTGNLQRMKPKDNQNGR